MTLDLAGAFDLPAGSAFRSVLFAGLAAAISVIARLRDPDSRRALWRVVLCGALCMPLLTVLVPPVAIGIVSAPHEWPTQAAEAANLRKAAAPVMRGPEPLAPDRSDLAAPREQASMGAAALVVYVSVALVLFGQVLAGWLQLVRLRRSARPVPSLAAPGIEIRELASCAVPITFGWRRPVILLPPSWREWPADQLNAILTHEIAHIAGRDFVYQTLSAIHRSLFWFSPLSWWLHARLVALGEESSDDAVLAADHDRVAYAELLYGFLQTSTSRASEGAICLLRGPSALGRIERILDTSHAPVAGASVRKRVLLFVPLAATLWLTAAVAAVREIPEGSSPVAISVVCPAPKPKVEIAQARPPAPPPPARPAPPAPPEPARGGKSANRLGEQAEELARAQAELGRRRAELDRQLAELNRSGEQALLRLPDIEQRIEELVARVTELKARKISPDRLEAVQRALTKIEAQVEAKLAEIQEQMREVQAELEAFQLEPGGEKARRPK